MSEEPEAVGFHWNGGYNLENRGKDWKDGLETASVWGTRGWTRERGSSASEAECQFGARRGREGEGPAAGKKERGLVTLKGRSVLVHRLFQGSGLGLRGPLGVKAWYLRSKGTPVILGDCPPPPNRLRPGSRSSWASLSVLTAAVLTSPLSSWWSRRPCTRLVLGHYSGLLGGRGRCGASPVLTGCSSHTDSHAVLAPRPPPCLRDQHGEAQGCAGVGGGNRIHRDVGMGMGLTPSFPISHAEIGGGGGRQQFGWWNGEDCKVHLATVRRGHRPVSHT